MQCGDALEQSRLLPGGIAKLIATSPPYFRKVDYRHCRQRGQEASRREYIAYQQELAAELLRIATPDAVMFWIIQDTFNGTGSTGGDYRRSGDSGAIDYRFQVKGAREPGASRKCQLLIPEYTRIALAEVGWCPILRITWDKKDSRRGAADRPSHSHEDVLVFSASDSAIQYEADEILLFAANPDHVVDRNAVLQEYSSKTAAQLKRPFKGVSRGARRRGQAGEDPCDTKRRMIEGIKSRPGALLRSVWEIPSEPAPIVEIPSPLAGEGGVRGELIEGIATFPLLLAEICVNLGSRPGDLVFDPYAGMGTTLLAASKWGRDAVGIELNPETFLGARHRLINEGLADFEDPKPWLHEFDGNQANALRAMSL